MLFVKVLSALLMAALFGSTSAANPQTCNHPYALCIAAKCDSAGHCLCDVFEGVSYAYGLPCSELAPHGITIYSTYSTRLSSNGIMTCPDIKRRANCMGAKCLKVGSKAICKCRLIEGTPQVPQGTLGGNCNPKQNCSSGFIWSTANVSLLKAGGAAQCPMKQPAQE